MTTNSSTTEAAALLTEAISALRATGRIVQKQNDGTYTVDGGAAISTGSLVALAWDTGLMGGSEGIQ